MKPPTGPKKQTQTNPILPTPKGVKQKSDAGFQRSDICLLPSVFWLLSMAPMIAIGFDYNGILECRKKARNKILFSVLVPALSVFVSALFSGCCELGPVGLEPTTTCQTYIWNVVAFSIIEEAVVLRPRNKVC